ncbi:hypothetical protein WR25_13006 isoform C [Diploscapter pachys]|uniref:Ig-like domain-containing protein n=1 Tax=Diploscapter pachys TaxID=2018661 RepID=A0A2A2L1B0_9BILA|nr:hypothetical protein WR25_13006 isoform A [Diploscapter pachys]PAV79954.1 hypothetical protein WR25_13006 isoform B [Diploscapter pachys]PAV79955.1 hypothetical protein WR25_13006 isoform C [Diploscapter pachys]
MTYFSLFPILLILLHESQCVDTFLPEPKAELIIQPNQNPVQKPAGEQISVLCILKGLLPESSEKPGIIWSKHSGLKGDHVEVKRLDARTLSLVIRNASSSDSGVYTCTAQTANAKYHKAVDVVVFEDLNFVEKQTMIGQVLPTASVNLSCEVKNEDESISTFWMRHGNYVGSGEHLLGKNPTKAVPLRNR